MEPREFVNAGSNINNDLLISLHVKNIDKGFSTDVFAIVYLSGFLHKLNGSFLGRTISIDVDPRLLEEL